MSGPGPRVPELNDRFVKGFCALIKRGLPVDGVCDYLGVASRVFWGWMKRGEIYLDGDGEPKQYAMCGKFILLLRKATAEYRLTLVDSLHSREAGRGQAWIRDMAILERRDRKNFSRETPAGGTMESFDPEEKFL